jgi:hypothetical protein
LDASPWLQAVVAELGDKYRLGKDTADGIQVTIRTGIEGHRRFNPIRVYLAPATQTVVGDYDVHLGEGQTVLQGRQFLDQRISPNLASAGLGVLKDEVEEWKSPVVCRRYSGVCADGVQAASAVRFMNEGSDLVTQLAAES